MDNQQIFGDLKFKEVPSRNAQHALIKYRKKNAEDT